MARTSLLPVRCRPPLNYTIRINARIGTPVRLHSRSEGEISVSNCDSQTTSRRTIDRGVPPLKLSNEGLFTQFEELVKAAVKIFSSPQTSRKLLPEQTLIFHLHIQKRKITQTDIPKCSLSCQTSHWNELKSLRMWYQASLLRSSH